MTTLAGAPAYTLPGVPVVHPSHLETGDASLATEVLPGPPPLLSVQQSAAKRDPKKPGVLFSYLPATDPGSTYSGNMAGTSTLGAPDADGPRRKRARVDKGSALGRAQRASARNLNAVPSPSDTLVTDGILAESSVLTIPDSDPLAMPIDLESPSLSRSNSAQNLGESSSSTSNGKTKGTRKGKGKQAEKAIVRVKEEEMAPPSLSPDPLATAANPPPKPPPSFMSPLILQAQNSGPREYQIPDDIRNFFKDGEVSLDMN
ncbi:hypothetical protein HWV62_24019 [Athelia sp. TMB]|nr:hypothetical protein HWV62_13443 [Athelia sp. TMB]KAF7983091.1 hypothetical protein HWV62_24019 [Athelia sp. TMB]